MLTFLRKIRRSLIESGSARRYLMYAAGETALVVLGILIALQINNWNQNRLNRQLEKLILLDLHNEFTENRRELHEKEAIRNFVISPSARLNEILERNEFPSNKAELDSLFNMSCYVATYDPRNGVLTNLIGSGQINLIQNRQLKTLITNWEGALSELREHEQVSYDITIAFASDYLIKSGLDLRNVNRFNYSNYLGGEYRPLEPSPASFDYKVYFNNPAIVNYLSIQHDMAQFAKIEARGIFDMIDQIITLIDSELE